MSDSLNQIGLIQVKLKTLDSLSDIEMGPDYSKLCVLIRTVDVFIAELTAPEASCDVQRYEAPVIIV